MARRLRKKSAKVWLLVSVVIALLFARAIYLHWTTDPLAAPDRLIEGQYRIEKMVDPVTFHVRATDGLLAERTFRVKLLGVKLPENLKEESPMAFEEAQRATGAFFRIDVTQESAGHMGTEPIVTLEFDRVRTDRKNTALAYVVMDGKRLNIELAKQGWVFPDPLAGNSSSIQRQIRLAAKAAAQQRVGVYRYVTPIEENSAD